MNTHALQQPQIERGTITVANIIPAKAQGRSAYIKDTDGMLFGIWPDKLGLIQPGKTYEIEFTANVKNGTTYRDIKQVHQVADQAPPARSLSSGASPQATSPNGNKAGEYYRPTAPRDAERMFVCSTLNAFIQTGRVECSKALMIDYVNELRGVWQETFGPDDH